VNVSSCCDTQVVQLVWSDGDSRVRGLPPALPPDPESGLAASAPPSGYGEDAAAGQETQHPGYRKPSLGAAGVGELVGWAGICAGGEHPEGGRARRVGAVPGFVYGDGADLMITQRQREPSPSCP
jgi:hypothetical protein